MLDGLLFIKYLMLVAPIPFDTHILSISQNFQQRSPIDNNDLIWQVFFFYSYLQKFHEIMSDTKMPLLFLSKILQKFSLSLIHYRLYDIHCCTKKNPVVICMWSEIKLNLFFRYCSTKCSPIFMRCVFKFYRCMALFNYLYAILS